MELRGQSVEGITKVATHPFLRQCGPWLQQPLGWGSGLRLGWLSSGSHQWTEGRGRGRGSGHWAVVECGWQLRQCTHCHVPDLVSSEPPQHLKDCFECLCLVLCACGGRRGGTCGGRQEGHVWETGKDTCGGREGGTHVEGDGEGHMWRETGRDTWGRRGGTRGGRQGGTCGGRQEGHVWETRKDTCGGRRGGTHVEGEREEHMWRETGRDT